MLPWEAERKLWNALEMIEFYPLKFWNLVYLVMGPRLLARDHHEPVAVSSDNPELDSAIWVTFLREGEEMMRVLSLPISAEMVSRIIFKVENKHHPGYEYPDNVYLTELENLQEILRSELLYRRFAYISPAVAEFFEQEKLFGQEVYDAFPEARVDIKDAGNCVAADLNTAAMFHLMRVAEFGLRRLAKRLKVALTHKGKPHPIEYADWKKVIDACKAKIANAQAASPGPKKQELLEQYADVADHCAFLKDIWRNNVSHTRKPYKRQDALAALERVRGFTQSLVAILS